jgi:aminomethyltransferase
LTDAPIDDLRYFRFLPEPVRVAGQPVTLLRTGFSGELGFELVTDLDSVVPLWDALVEAGGTPFGLEAIEIARIEAGLLIIGVDYQPGESSPSDLSMDRFVKRGTECVGAEALADAAASPSKRFVGVRIDAEAAPEYGTAVSRNGREVGVLTSAVVSPRLGTIGLAILETDAATDGTELEVDGAKGTVGPLNQYDPERRRPRS